MNWEREPGEKVEEFVAALLLLEHPHGNLITPSRGDRGVDIRVWHPDGFDIYQVKRYTRPLEPKQVTAVENSWSTFVRKTLPVLPVRSWTLVTPWNPTNDRLDWLNYLTAGAGIPCHWIGRTNLDVMAAQRSSLIDYYFGDGGQRLHRLMADALQGSRDMPRGIPAMDMLAAAVDRQRGIVAALNELDPFYRYELDIRTGAVHDQPWDLDTRGQAQAAYIQYHQLDKNQYWVLRLVPLSAESPRLRPITMAARLEVSPGSPEHQAVKDFLQFGAPFNDVPGVVTEVAGPPGVASSALGPGLFRFMVTSESAADLPDLEVRLVAPDGSVRHTVDLADVKASLGIHGQGSWLSGRDRGGAVEFQFFLNGDDGHTVQLKGCSLTGKTPAEVLPGVRLTADLRPGMGLVAAIRGGGGAITPVWEMGDEPLAPVARWHVRLLDALTAIQQHTYHRVTVPDVDATPREELDAILRVGRLLRGEQIEATWSEVPLEVASTDRLPSSAEEFVFAGIFPMTVRLNGREVTLDMRRRVLYCSARLADPMQASSIQAGDTLRLVPGSTNRAIIAAMSANDAVPPP